MAQQLKTFMSRMNENERLKHIRSRLPPLNFITVHYLYFIITCLLTSIIFWGSSHPSKSITYTDSLFLVISAMTEAGLNTVNLSQMTTFQQVILWLLIVMGSSIFVSIGTVLTRKRVFEKRFERVVSAQKDARRMRKRNGFSNGEMSTAIANKTPVESSDGNGENGIETTLDIAVSRVDAEDHAKPSTERPRENGASLAPDTTSHITDTSLATKDVKFEDQDAITSPGHAPLMRYPNSPAPAERPFLTFTGVGAHPNANATGYKSPYSNSIYQRANKKFPEKEDDEETVAHGEYPNYLTRSTTGRNSQFFGLNKEQREHLGGVEYRAISLLSWIVPIYFVLWQLLGCIGLGAYVAYNKPEAAAVNAINPWWVGIFNGVSAFNNSGMSLLDLNMIPFQTSSYTLITMGILILAGNTAYPLILRLILWSGYKTLNLLYPDSAHHTDHKATLRFILTYPRRVYTNLFPATPSWWLLLMLIATNSIDWIAFELLNIGNHFTTAIPTGYRVLDGLFQALAVRSGGFYIIPIPNLRIGLQFLYVIMMYISVYPVVITMRHSNVYEERSLGIYADETDDENEDEPPKLGTLSETFRRTFTSAISGPFASAALTDQNRARTQFVRQQVRGQLAHDLWWLALAVFLICCIEVSNFERDPVTYSVFNIIFEVVSGYGCVGISTGLPDQAYSFSGGWHVASKLVLCAVMLRGRHRGLPVALDRAVRLPGSEPGVIEEEDRLVRRASMPVLPTPGTGYSASPFVVEERRIRTPQMKGLGLKQM